MKRILALVLTIGIVFTLAGCSSISKDNMRIGLAQTEECVELGFSRAETISILKKKLNITEEQADQVIIESRTDWRLAAMCSAVTFLFIGDNQYAQLRYYLIDIRKFTSDEADYVIDVFNSAVEANPNY